MRCQHLISEQAKCCVVARRRDEPPVGGPVLSIGGNTDFCAAGGGSRDIFVAGVNEHWQF